MSTKRHTITVSALKERTAIVPDVSNNGVSNAPTAIMFGPVASRIRSGTKRYSPGLERSSTISARATVQAPEKKPGGLPVIASDASGLGVASSIPATLVANATSLPRRFQARLVCRDSPRKLALKCHWLKTTATIPSPRKSRRLAMIVASSGIDAVL